MIKQKAEKWEKNDEYKHKMARVNQSMCDHIIILLIIKIIVDTT